MRRVFKKFLGSALFSSDDTIGLKLADGLGAVEEVVVVPDIAEDIAHALMTRQAQVLREQEQGVPTTGPAGEPLRGKALRVDALEYRTRIPDDGRPILLIRTESGAEYQFVFPREYEDRVKALGSRNL